MVVQAPLASLRNCLAAQPNGHLLAVVREPGTVALSDRRRPDAEVTHWLCASPQNISATDAVMGSH